MDTLRKEAKRWLKALRQQDPDAQARFERVLGKAPSNPGLRDVHHALARERGYDGWIALTRAVREKRGPEQTATLRATSDYERAAEDWVAAFNARDPDALARLSGHYGIPLTLEDLGAIIWRRIYAFRQRSSKVEKNVLQPDEARWMVAQDAGFGSWSALLEAIGTGAPPNPGF